MELARALRQSFDLEPVFIGASGDNLMPFSAWRSISGANLPELARLMRDCALFVGNDSGPAHVAAAFGVPEVVLFGPSSLTAWAPWRTPAEALQADRGIEMIEVSRVIGAVEKLQVSAA